MSNPAEAVIECIGVNRFFKSGPEKLHILRDVSLAVCKGETIAITGSSGSGKSTLLQCLGGLDNVNSGELLIQGQNYPQLSSGAKAALRNQALGFVYQFHHLLPEFSALENVAMPLLIRGESVSTATDRAEAMLGRTGLAQRLLHKPSELSGGERQRAAIARALVTEPACLLADEPTGNLDSHTAQQVHELILEMNQLSGCALVMVTHEQRLADKMQKKYLLKDGRLTLENQ
jgi:lipoprotein-releasing system ATP-binding protein